LFQSDFVPPDFGTKLGNWGRLQAGGPVYLAGHTGKDHGVPATLAGPVGARPSKNMKLIVVTTIKIIVIAYYLLRT
jgi:hypothetical protein